jgi:hypothetical protein
VGGEAAEEVNVAEGSHMGEEITHPTLHISTVALIQPGRPAIRTHSRRQRSQIVVVNLKAKASYLELT